MAGKAKPWFKSEKAPEENSGPVTVVVGDTFKEIVMDTTKDVLLEVCLWWAGTLDSTPLQHCSVL